VARKVASPQHLELGATVTAELVTRRRRRRNKATARVTVADVRHSGGGILTHSPDRGYRFVEVRDLPS
jgi:hypothetical protein